jgi:NhaA family Na+:H+ antiporter
MLVRGLFGRHPATPFTLLVAIAANAIGWAFVASAHPLLHVRPDSLVLLGVALGIAGIMRSAQVRPFWPYLMVPGPIAWWSLYAMGITPALCLVPIVPFLQHSRRAGLFEERTHSAHDSSLHLEHALKYPVHVVLFLFGVANAGVMFSGYGTGTWALLVASLVGKPIGLLAGAGLALLAGLHQPRGLHWRDLAVVSMATSGGFATALFFATAVYPVGPLLGELKLGVIASGVGVLLTLALAWAEGRGAARERSIHAHHPIR